MKKKVCLVVSSAMTVHAFLREPINRLCEDYDVHVAVNLGPEESLPGLDEAVKVLPVGIERNISPRRDFLALWRMLLLFRRHRFDLVHSVTPKAGMLAMTSAFLAGVDVRIHTFTGQVWATRSGFSRWLLKNADRWIVRMSTDILVDSASQRRFLLEEGVLSEEKSDVLAQGSISGVDTSRFKPNSEARNRIRSGLSIPAEDTVFIYLGRLNRDKGLLDLACAFAGIDDTGAHLLMVGPDEERIVPQIRKLAAETAKRLHFVEFTTNPEEYLAASDVLCLPSYREGFGNVVIEAAAVGIPAIASRIYGLVDAVAEHESGLLFEARNVQELKACLSALCSDKALRGRLGRQARERVLANFTGKRLAESWLEYYRDRL